MSYILEALKKADAERERSRVPDLHAQPDPHADRDRRRSRGRKVWLGAALLGLLGASVVWWALRPPPEPLVAGATVGMAPAAQRAIDPTPPPTPSPSPSPSVIAVQIAPPSTPRVVGDAARPPVAATAMASAPAAAPRVPTLAELPAEVRSQLPALSVGGSMYSTSASVRMVILSGQVFREGDSPAPGLTVVQIGPKSTVLAFRGQRFELKH